MRTKRKLRTRPLQKWHMKLATGYSSGHRQPSIRQTLRVPFQGPIVWRLGVRSETSGELTVRSNQVGNAGSRPISEAKQPGACPVLGWRTFAKQQMRESLADGARKQEHEQPGLLVMAVLTVTDSHSLVVLARAEVGIRMSVHADTLLGNADGACGGRKEVPRAPLRAFRRKSGYRVPVVPPSTLTGSSPTPQRRRLWRTQAGRSGFQPRVPSPSCKR